MLEDKNNNNHLLTFLPYLIFFTGSFLFFGFFADYVEFYQEKTSLFVFSRDYLVDGITQPGFLLVYLGRFLTTFYYYPAAGAIIISSDYLPDNLHDIKDHQFSVRQKADPCSHTLWNSFFVPANELPVSSL